MTKQEKLYFSYKSPANIVRLLITIMFEQTYTPRDIAVYHERFDKEPDDTYQTFMETIFPQGCTIGENEINMLTKYVYNFMKQDVTAMAIYDRYIERDKKTCRSYVYTKYDKQLYPAGVGSHADIVTRLCVEYFKDFDHADITPQKVETFIRNNIEIKSDFTSIDTVCQQGNLFHTIREIVMGRDW